MYEVNVSVKTTALKIIPHRRPASPDPETQFKVLSAGTYVQLFHKEMSAYLAAEGSSFKFGQDDSAEQADVRENVHLRVREPDPRRPHRLLPPTSAVSVSTYHWPSYILFSLVLASRIGRTSESRSAREMECPDSASSCSDSIILDCGFERRK